MSDGSEARRSSPKATKGRDDNQSIPSSFFRSPIETKDHPETEKHIEVQIIEPGLQGKSPKLLLPRAMFDSLSASEKKALPKMFEQFITSRAFRSTMTYDLNSLPGLSTTPEPKKKPFGDSNSSLKPLSTKLLAKRRPLPLFSFGHIHSRRTSYRFPLLDLPAELRIMIAKYVLCASYTLQWFWKNYRKGPRVATLGDPRAFGTRSEYIEDLTSLARTCKQIYQETRGLVTQVNVVSFSLYRMHPDQVPKICRDESGGSNSDLRAVSEALDFMQKFAPRELHQSLKHIKIFVQDLNAIRHHWHQFENLVGCSIDTRVTVTVTIRNWRIAPFTAYDRKRLELLEDDGEAFVPEHEQMRQRADDYLSKRQQVQDFVANLDQRPRNWRIHPFPIQPRHVKGLKDCLPGDVWDIMQATADHGI